MRAIQVPRRFVRQEWGGTETVILETAKRLPAFGVETGVVCPNALADCDEESIEGVAVRRFPYFYPYWGLKQEAIDRLDRKGGNLFSFPLLRHLKHDPGLDLVHLHTGKRLGGICRHVAMKRGIPYVISVHGGVIDVPQAEAETWTNPTRGTIEWGKALGFLYGSRRVFDDAAAILCVDYEETGKMAERYPDKRVIHLPNGVDPARFAAGDRARFRDRIGIGQDMPLLLNVSRIDHQKNQWLAVDILARLLEGGQNMHLALIGPITNPAYHERLAKAIADQNLSDYVTIIPGLPPGDPLLADAYKSADAFLLTSLHEPFGIVILEAWAAGCPVVCTSVGGIPHFTEDGEDTLRFASGDAGAATSHLRQLLSTPSLAARLVENGRRKALGTYSWDRITEQLANLYQEVRGERTSR